MQYPTINPVLMVFADYKRIICNRFCQNMGEIANAKHKIRI